MERDPTPKQIRSDDQTVMTSSEWTCCWIMKSSRVFVWKTADRSWEKGSRAQIRKERTFRDAYMTYQNSPLARVGNR